jgi:cytochrome P450
MLTLLRHPYVLQRLRRQPDLAVRVVEELLRYEPPVQFLGNRSALDGTTIPRGTITNHPPRRPRHPRARRRQP